jgi:predicted nucleic acid-binding protein
VKLLFDTSVMVAAALPQHPSHAPCFAQLQAAKNQTVRGFLSTHSLAEFYSVTTRMPSQPRMSPQDATRLLQSYLQYLEAIALEAAEYVSAIEQMTTLGIPGGGIFDALIAQAALKADVDKILTLNPKHFTRLQTSIAQMVEVPK